MSDASTRDETKGIVIRHDEILKTVRSEMADAWSEINSMKKFQIQCTRERTKEIVALILCVIGTVLGGSYLNYWSTTNKIEESISYEVIKETDKLNKKVDSLLIKIINNNNN